MSMDNSLGVTTSCGRRTIPVATGVKSPVVDTLDSVPISFGDMVVKLDFLVVEGSSFHVIIGD